MPAVHLPGAERHVLFHSATYTVLPVVCCTELDDNTGVLNAETSCFHSQAYLMQASMCYVYCVCGLMPAWLLSAVDAPIGYCIGEAAT